MTLNSTSKPDMSAMHHNHPETDENNPPVSSRKKRADVSHSYPAEARAAIGEARVIQQGLRTSKAMGKNWSDADFVGGFLHLSENAWFQLQSGTYPWPKTTAGSAGLVRKLIALVEYGTGWQRQAANIAIRAAVKPVGETFIEFPEYGLLKKAIKRAKERVTEAIEERLIIVVGPSRSGKTMMFRKLLEDEIATWAVSAMPSWRRSYFAMLEDLHEQVLGVSPKRRSATLAEKDLKRHFAKHGGVMEVIELQHICADSQAFLKTLLNETTLVLVWFMTPKNFERLLVDEGGDLDDRRQLLGRCTEIIRIGAESAETVRQMAPELWAGVPDDDGRLQRIADEANRLGYKTLIRVVSKSLKDLVSAGREPSAAEVEAALKAFRTCVPVPTFSRRSTTARQAA